MTSPAGSSHRKAHRADRIVASGLAVAACVGVVTVLGVRSSEPTRESGEDGEPRTAEGLTRADLEAYAGDLVNESVLLSAYRERLRVLAAELAAEMEAFGQVADDGTAVDPSTVRELARSLEGARGDGGAVRLPTPDTSSYSS